MAWRLRRNFQYFRLKQDVLKKKPKLVKQQDENEDKENESEEEKESEDEEEPIEEGDTMEEDDNDGKVTEKFFRKQFERIFYANPLTLFPPMFLFDLLPF